MSHPSGKLDDAGTVISEGESSSPGLSVSLSASATPIVSVQKQGSAMEPSRTAMRCRIGLAITGISLGCMVFLVFLALEQFRNYHIACWGLVSGIFAVFTLVIHIQHIRGDRDVWVNRLKAPIIIGFIAQIGSIAAFITYIVLAVVGKQPLMPLNGADHGYYITAVWIFMTWKWSFALFWYSRSYRKVYITKGCLQGDFQRSSRGSQSDGSTEEHDKEEQLLKRDANKL